MEWKVLYHYTSLDAFVNIVKSKEFRLFDIKKSNDPLEGAYMLEALSNAYRELYRHDDINENQKEAARLALFYFEDAAVEVQTLENDFFAAASFCVPKHELMMLRSYGDNGKGIAIGVSKPALMKLSKRIPELKFQKIEYLSKKEIENRAEDFWQTHLLEYKNHVDRSEEKLKPLIEAVSKEYENGFFIKSEENKDEEEYRLLYHGKDLFKRFRFSHNAAMFEGIDFISKNGELKAYYKIPLGKDKSAPFYFNDVHIGPLCNATEGEMTALLKKYDISVCGIQKNSRVHMR